MFNIQLFTGNEVGAGISIEALEDEGYDLTSLVCDPKDSGKEGPYVFHFPPNPEQVNILSTIKLCSPC